MNVYIKTRYEKKYIYISGKRLFFFFWKLRSNRLCTRVAQVAFNCNSFTGRKFLVKKKKTAKSLIRGNFKNINHFFFKLFFHAITTRVDYNILSVAPPGKYDIGLLYRCTAMFRSIYPRGINFLISFAVNAISTSTPILCIT